MHVSKTLTGLLSPLVPLVLLLGSAACVDPAARLDDFYEESEPFRIAVVSGECNERVDLSGDFLFSLATTVNPSAPILFQATFDIDTAVDPWALTLTLQPLAVDGRAPVGEALVASGTVAAEGTFEVDFGEITIDGAANAIIADVEASAILIISGCTNAAAFSCGNVDGAITSPAQLPLAGSTYGAVAVEGDIATLEPVSACPE
jgi:hypothetical protein